MSAVVISNAFSLNMLAMEVGITNLQICPASPDVIRQEIEEEGGFESIVGHADTAALFSTILGLDVPCNRASFTMDEGTTLFVGQYKGPRLPEGATSLPEGATVEWAMVLVVSD